MKFEYKLKTMLDVTSETLNKEGEDGWQLVAISSSSSMDFGDLSTGIFMREKEES